MESATLAPAPPLPPVHAHEYRDQPQRPSATVGEEGGAALSPLPVHGQQPPEAPRAQHMQASGSGSGGSGNGIAAGLATRVGAMAAIMGDGGGGDGTGAPVPPSIIPSTAEEGGTSTPPQTPSTTKYRGVCRHASGRYQANLRVKGKLLHLGRHRTPEDAARVFDRAALFARGAKQAKTNFHPADYQVWLQAVQGKTLTQVAQILRAEYRPPKKPAKGRAAASAYKGVWAHANGRWQSNIRMNKKVVRLGTHALEVAAARAYDLASIRLDARAATAEGAINFPIAEYQASGQLAHVLGMSFDDLVKV